MIQRHAESLYLAPGVAGAVVLKGRRSDSGKVRRLDWESATTQREGEWSCERCRGQS